MNLFFVEFFLTSHFCFQDIKELAALAYRDTTQENREFWKNEMGQALREIQQTYDEKLELMRGEMETYYNLKVRWSTIFFQNKKIICEVRHEVRVSILFFLNKKAHTPLEDKNIKTAVSTGSDHHQILLVHIMHHY